MVSRRSFWALPATLLWSHPSFAQTTKEIRRLDGTTISAEKIDSTVTSLMRAAEVTGVGLSLIQSGKVVYSKAYGFRDVENKLPLTQDSVLAGASFTKAAFAYMVMQLVEAGALGLDKPIQNYLPKPLHEYPAYQDLVNDDRWKRITPRMLLAHTVGFPNLRFLAADGKLNINFEPGSRYAYSGEGMLLLQLVVETITGKPLTELMDVRVFGPLRMSRTSMISEPRFVEDSANGYDEWGRSLGRQQRINADAAGSMQTTIRDFTRFLLAVSEGHGLRRSTREQMLSPQIRIFSRRQFPTLTVPTGGDESKKIQLSYGLGWGLYRSPQGKVFFKEGHDNGFRNYAVVFDERKYGMVIMTNSSNGEGIFKELLETVMGNPYTPIEWEGFTPYNELPPRAPLPVRTEVRVEVAKLDRLTGDYVLPPVTLRVTRKENRLQMQENGGKPGDLFPEAELRFFSKTSDDVITFELDENGRPLRLVIHTGGRQISVSKAP